MRIVIVIESFVVEFDYRIILGIVGAQLVDSKRKLDYTGGH